MKTTLSKRPAILPAMILCLLLAGCGGDDAGDAKAVEEQPPATETPASESTGESAPVDWSAVPAPSDPYAGTGLAMELARQLTAWHDGAHRYVLLSIDADGAVTDPFGNVVHKELSHWKALVNDIRSQPKRSIPMLTPRADFAEDGLGELRKLVYIITVNSPDELQFMCEGEFEG
ncbi:MAG: hypothetical protein SYC29_07905 [Planctomycetota bacterium]|nr:hypothetical protein [Planctomycetota bacterium]